MHLAICILCLVLTVVSTTNPGFRARITQNGLNYANKVAIDAVSSDVQKMKIPDSSGKSGRVSYEVYNIVITSFTKPSSKLVLHPNKGLGWSATGLGIGLSGTIHYKYKQGWIKISDHIRFTASVSGVSFSLTIGFTKDVTGRPAISGSGCTSSIGNVNIKFHGGAAWLYNLFRGMIANKIKDALQSKFCGIVLNAVKKNAEKSMQKIPVTVTVAKKFLLDYRLVSNPLFTSAYMETDHKGEIYWKGEKKEAPFLPRPFQTNPNSTRMLYLWVSDYMANTLTYNGFRHGYLVYNLTAKDLPPKDRSVLNTTCKFKCIGFLIPQIGKKYPKTQVKLNLKATKAPVTQIGKNTISINFAGDIDLYAIKPRGNDAYLLTINTTMSVTASVNIKGQLVTGKVNQFSIRIGVSKSVVGNITSKQMNALNFIVQLVINTTVIPMLNKAGAKGLVLPVTGDVQFRNAQIQLQEHAIMIATDILYSPKLTIDDVESEIEAWRSQNEARPLLRDRDNNWLKSESVMVFQDVNRKRRPFNKLHGSWTATTTIRQHRINRQCAHTQFSPRLSRMRVTVAALLLLSTCLQQATPLNPGFKARVSQKGFHYANEVALEALALDAKKLKIPDTSGTSGKLSYTVSGVSITKFVKPSSSLILTPPTGITWTASGAGIGLKGTLHYTYHFIFPISDTIDFDASVGGISFKLGIALHNGTGGRLHISTSSCSDNIGGVSINFHGGAAWLYNLFSKIIDRKVKDALQGQFCTIVTKLVNIDAEKRLAQIPVTVVLANIFLLDYHLISNPDITPTFMDIFLKGEIFWKTDREEAPFSPAPLPASSESSRMLYLWLTPYMANTLGYVALRHGFLKYNLTAKDLPPGKRPILNTTCTNVECIGVLIPQIGQKYPNSRVKLNMDATKSPLMKISSGLIGVKFAGNIDMYIDTITGTGPHLLTINCTMYVTVTVSLTGQLLKGKIIKESLDVGVVRSDVGIVNAKVLQFLMGVAAKTFIIPLVNAWGQKGLVLPITDDIHLVNTDIKILQNAVMVASDVSYKPKLISEVSRRDPNLNRDSDAQLNAHVAEDGSFDLKDIARSVLTREIDNARKMADTH
ncbi:uncharacterized protein LOC121388412 [Gigantopelta aegis]|uniref:uncharacterized protein LOC121388412 n=1 Tax=Gigantopelta aegis TaxID=1735272 RepID=UPI001B88B5C1|nr:uncharacterized protein LOC121388412 [Gigantopelta aegis]